jgi:hypothetical protein
VIIRSQRLQLVHRRPSNLRIFMAAYLMPAANLQIVLREEPCHGESQRDAVTPPGHRPVLVTITVIGFDMTGGLSGM